MTFTYCMIICQSYNQCITMVTEANLGPVMFFTLKFKSIYTL